MTKSSLARGLVPAAALLLVASGRADKLTGATEDVLSLVKDMEAKKDVAMRAATLAKRHELVEVMRAFKATDKGGIGFGRTGDALDGKIAQLARHELDALSVKGRRDDLVRLARVCLAVGEVVAHYTPAKPTPGMGVRQWKSHAEDLKKAARALETAVGTADGAKVKAAALRVNNACNNCHADFDAAASIHATSPPRRDVGKDVFDLAGAIGNQAMPDGISATAGRLRKTHPDLYEIMVLFKPKAKGGVGYDKAGTGIERKIALLEKSKLTAAALAKEKDDLIRMANVTLAVAELTALYSPSRPQQAKQTTRWKRRVAVLKIAANELKEAAEGEDAAEVRKAAEGLAEACKNCHTLYR